MWRSRTLPPARAALTMTLTAGFCIRERTPGAERTGRVYRRGKEQAGPGPGAEFTIDAMDDPAPPISSERDAGLRRIRIVLVGTQHPGNIGSAARAVKTMGLSRLVLVAPE